MSARPAPSPPRVGVPRRRPAPRDPQDEAITAAVHQCRRLWIRLLALSIMKSTAKLEEARARTIEDFEAAGRLWDAAVEQCAAMEVALERAEAHLAALEAEDTP